MSLILSPLKKSLEGFTLIELLIAIFISSLLFTMLIFGLKTMINNYQTLESHAYTFKQLQMNILDIQEDFLNLLPRNIVDENNLKLPPFMGRGDYIEMTTSRNKVIRRAYLYDADNQVLIERTWKVLDRVKPNQFKDKILFRQVSSFNIEYLNEKKNSVFYWPESNAENNQDTNQKGIYPDAIKITIELSKKGKISRFFLIRKSL